MFEPIKSLALRKGLDLLSQDFDDFISMQIPVYTRRLTYVATNNKRGSKIRPLFETIFTIENFNEIQTQINEKERCTHIYQHGCL